MASIFLSHSSLDKPLVRRIANDLTSAGHAVWLDEWEIYVGHSIAGKIQEGLEKCDFIAVLLTANSVRSGWVEKEWQSRIDREIRMRSVEILPLKADDCEVPPLLRDKKWADLTNYEAGLAEVLNALSHHRGRRPNGGGARTRQTEQPHRRQAKPEKQAPLPGRPTVPGEPHWPPEWGKSPSERIRAAEERFRFIKRSIVIAGTGVVVLLFLVRCHDSWYEPSPTGSVASDDTVRPPVSATPAATTPASTARPESPPQPAPGSAARTIQSRQKLASTPNPAGDVAAHTRKSTQADRFRLADPVFGYARDVSKLIDCAPTGCSFQRSDLCTRNAKLLRLGRTQETEEFSYDLQKCEPTDPEPRDYIACFSAPDSIFPLRPGETVFASVEFSDRSRLYFELKVESPFRDEANWIELLPAGGAPSHTAPFAAARLNLRSDSFMWSNSRQPFNIFVGVGGCRDTPSRISKVLYDLDGQGLVEVEGLPRKAGSHDLLPTYFDLPQVPVDSKLAIALGNTSGKRLGPFEYRFDVARILKAASKQAGEPRLDCYDGHCWAPGKSSPLAWLQVRAIEFGTSADELRFTQTVSTSQQYLLGEDSRNRPGDGDIAKVSIPRDWANVYYRLVLESGNSTEVIRVQMR